MVAGLIAGKALTLTRRTHETFPELRRLFAGRLQPSDEPTGEVWFHATTLKRFAAAQRADGDPAEVWDWLVQGAATYSGTAPADDDVDDQPDDGEQPAPRVTLHVPEWGPR